MSALGEQVKARFLEGFAAFERGRERATGLVGREHIGKNWTQKLFEKRQSLLSAVYSRELGFNGSSDILYTPCPPSCLKFQDEISRFAELCI
jgi:hypothetical protein